MPIILGRAVTLFAGGAPLPRRIVSSAVCGVLTGVFAAACSVILGAGQEVPVGEIAAICAWRTFVVTVLTTIAAGAVEIALPEPQSK